jgi:putative AlgH/UPF0301 family transcriptional regulator
MRRHGWLMVAANEELLFETSIKECWPRAFATAGIDVRPLAPTSGRS